LEVGVESLIMGLDTLCLTLGEFLMKKTLIALAAVAAVSASYAQVTLYGKVDMGLGFTTLTNGVSTTVVNSGQFNGSRFGLKGSDDLGAGMSMSFQMEAGVGADTGASGQGGLLFGRQAYISLNTAGGNISAGRQYTPGDNAMCGVDLSGCAGAAGGALYATYMSNAATGDNFGASRQNNSVAYTLPGGLGGLMGQVMLAPDENGATASNAFQGVWLGYVNGPFAVHGAYEASTAVGANMQRSTFLGTTYNAGFATVGLSTNVGNNAALTNDVGYAIQLAMPLGPINAIAAFATETSTADQATISAKTNAWSIQGVYALSKKSRAYAGYTSKTDTAAPANSPAITGTTLAFGMQTDF
jgi:predicted porin